MSLGKPDRPPEGLILDALGRIEKSEQFRNAESMGKILRMSVEGTLAGNPPLARHIAAAIWTPYALKKDPEGLGIRVQAKKVRKKIEEYKKSEGAAELVWIDLPSGAYKAVFSYNPNAPLMLHLSKAQAHKDVLVFCDGLEASASDETHQAIKLQPQFSAGYPALVECDYLHVVLNQLVLGLQPGPWAARSFESHVHGMLDKAEDECHTCLLVGGILAVECSWERSRKYFDKAQTIDPVRTKGSLWYALFLLLNGNFDEALEISGMNLEIYPWRDSVRVCHAFFMYLTRRSGIKEVLRKTVGNTPQLRRVILALTGYCEMAAGKYGLAFGAFNNLFQNSELHTSNRAPQIGALIECSVKTKHEFIRDKVDELWLKKIEDETNSYIREYRRELRNDIDGIQRMFFYRANGRGRDAITAFRSACLVRHPVGAALWLWPFLDDYRDHPRLAHLAKRLNIPETQRIATEKLIAEKAAANISG